MDTSSSNPLPPVENAEGITPALPDVKKSPTADENRRRFLSILPFYAQRSNMFISRVNKLMSTSQGKDRALMTLNYLLIALSSQVDAFASLRSNLDKATKFSILPTEVFPNSPALFILSRRPKELSKLYAASTRLKALAALISDVRIFMRLWGLFTIWQWGVTTWQSPPKDKVQRFIAYLQVTASFLFQIFENTAYLAKHSVLPLDGKKQTKLWLWSARCWATNVALEFVRLARDKQIRSKGKETAWYNIAEEEKDSQWLRQLYTNMALAPLTIHWSLKKGCLSQATVGSLGTIAGLIGLQQAWKNTA